MTVVKEPPEDKCYRFLPRLCKSQLVIWIGLKIRPGVPPSTELA